MKYISDEVNRRINEIASAKSMFSDLPRKPLDQRIEELVDWYQRYDDINLFYNDYGFDIVGLRSNPDDFLDYGVFKEYRYRINSGFIPCGSRFPYDYTVVFRDKRLFDSYFRRVDSDRVINTHAYILEGRLLPVERYVTEENFCHRYLGRTLAFKRTFGQNGSGLMAVTIASNNSVYIDGKEILFSQFLDSLAERHSSWIVQDWIIQHPFYASLNKSSINTMRIVTFNTGNRVVASNQSLIVGLEGNIINNIAGNLIDYSISDKGTFCDYAMNMALYRREKCSVAGKNVPLLEEALALVKRFHEAIPEVFTVGWDVAFTPSGPIVVEGNDGWHPANIQRSSGCGARPLWDKMVAERKKFQNL